jgi:hypothetical protein
VTDNPVQTIEQARQLIESFSGRVEDFNLPVSDELQDAIGMNMAIITDYILKKGWEPDGFSQHDGYRVYRYKTLV